MDFVMTNLSYGFSQLRALEFFVFRKMEMPETQNPPAMRVESINIKKKITFSLQ